MRSIVTEGIICLKDNWGIEYYISDIRYVLWENEEFEYTFRPNYPVIDLLDSTLFQGIPGLELDERKGVYIRRNIVPTFISERSPAKNRENLWELLEECGMDYLNPLEWLIRTDTKYIGDRLYVRGREHLELQKAPIDFAKKILGIKRSADINRKLLEAICYGYDIDFEGFVITDENRKECYNLLVRLYRKESGYLLERQMQGILFAKEEGRYSGRKAISIDDTKLDEIIRKYERKRITAEEAANILQVSRSTFFRRMKKYKETIGGRSCRQGNKGDT